MNKEIKKKIIISVVAILLGLAILVSAVIFKNVFTEDKKDYIAGFSSGLIVVGMVIFIRTIFALSGADKGKELANKLHDERLIAINNEASEITFRITIFIAAIANIVLFILGMEKEVRVVSVFIGLSTLIYLVSYFVLSRKR